VLGEAKSEHVVLRTTITRGVTGRGLWPKTAPDPTIPRSATPWNKDLFARPVRLIISTIVRNAGSPTSRLKTIGYLDNILAAREAVEMNADDALLLNAGGKVACTTIANVFALIGGKLLTHRQPTARWLGSCAGLCSKLPRRSELTPPNAPFCPRISSPPMRSF